MDTTEITGIIAVVLGAMPFVIPVYLKWKRKGIAEVPFDNREISSGEEDAGLIKSLLNPRSGRLPFVAREDLKDSLLKKCRESGSSQIEYIVLLGEGGAGKTRLAAELCLELAKEKNRCKRPAWNTGFLKINSLDNRDFLERDNLKKWWNVRKNLIVIDEVSFLLPGLLEWLTLLENRRNKWKNKLVLVLIDRDRDWIEQLINKPGYGDDHPVCRRLVRSTCPLSSLKAEEAGLLFNSCMDLCHQEQKGETSYCGRIEEAMKLCKEGMLQEYRKINGTTDDEWRKRSFYIIMEAIFRYDLLMDSVGRGMVYTFNPQQNCKKDLLAYFVERDRKKLKTMISEEEIRNKMDAILQELVACQMLAGNDSQKLIGEIFQLQDMEKRSGNEVKRYKSLTANFIKNSISIKQGMELNPIGFYFVADSLHLIGDEGDVNDDLLEVCFRMGGTKTWENWNNLARKIPELSETLARTGNRLWKEKLKDLCDSPEKWDGVLSVCCSGYWCCKAMEDIVRDIHAMKVSMARDSVIPGDVNSEIPLARALYAQGAMLHACSQDQAALPFLKESLRIWRRIIRQEENVSFTGDFGKTFNTLILCFQSTIKTSRLVKAMNRIIPLLKEALPESKEAHQALASSLRHLGASLIDLGKDSEAETVCTESVELWRTFDRDDPEAKWGLANALENLGLSWINRGEGRKAEPFLRESVELWRTSDLRRKWKNHSSLGKPAIPCQL